jgi:hypothetical protein
MNFDFVPDVIWNEWNYFLSPQDVKRSARTSRIWHRLATKFFQEEIPQRCNSATNNCKVPDFFFPQGSKVRHASTCQSYCLGTRCTDVLSRIAEFFREAKLTVTGKDGEIRVTRNMDFEMQCKGVFYFASFDGKWLETPNWNTICRVLSVTHSDSIPPLQIDVKVRLNNSDLRPENSLKTAEEVRSLNWILWYHTKGKLVKLPFSFVDVMIFSVPRDVLRFLTFRWSLPLFPTVFRWREKRKS